MIERLDLGRANISRLPLVIGGLALRPSFDLVCNFFVVLRHETLPLSRDIDRYPVGTWSWQPDKAQSAELRWPRRGYLMLRFELHGRVTAGSPSRGPAAHACSSVCRSGHERPS